MSTNTKDKNRTAAFRKHQRRRIIRKRMQTIKNGNFGDLVIAPGKLNKNKVNNCSCIGCVIKTKTSGLSAHDLRQPQMYLKVELN